MPGELPFVFERAKLADQIEHRVSIVSLIFNHHTVSLSEDVLAEFPYCSTVFNDTLREGFVWVWNEPLKLLS